MPLLPRTNIGGFSNLLRSARKEWRHLSDTRRLFSNDGLGLVLLLSGALLVGSLILSWKRQEEAFRVTNQNEVRLVNWRVRGYMVTALDWGQRDSTYNFLTGKDADFVARDLSNTPIVRDSQNLLLVRLDGTVAYDSLASTGVGLPPQHRSAIRICLLERLKHLQTNIGANDRNAYGVLCKLPQSLVLGAAARVTRSTAKGASAGWILPYNLTPTGAATANKGSVLADIAPKLTLMSKAERDAQRPIGNDPKETLDYFLAAEPPDQVWVIRQPWIVNDIISGAFTETVLPWATVNLAMLALTLASLNNARRIRLQHCREQRRSRRLLHNYRILDQGRDLLSLPAFLEIAGRPLRPSKERTSGPHHLLGDVTAQIHTFSIDTNSQISTQASLVASLHERLRDLLPDAKICRTPENTLALLTPGSVEDDGGTVQALEIAIGDTRQKFASSVRADIRAALTPLKPEVVEKQISDLAILNRYGISDSPVVVLPASDDTLLAKVREKISSDFAATTFAERITDVAPRMEDVIRIVEDDRSICYREMLFRFPEDDHPRMEIQELILALERSNSIHLIDLLMLRKALDLLGAQEHPRVQLGANLSAQTVQSSRYRDEILALLKQAPAEVRQHLILEVTETAIIGGPELWKGFLLELGSLGVKVSIDDFGSGYASLSHLFEFHADFIKVDMKYTRMVPNHEVNAMVNFLLSFEVNSATRVIMEGIESEEQLRHWQGLGVSHFQGYLFSPHR